MATGLDVGLTRRQLLGRLSLLGGCGLLLQTGCGELVDLATEATAGATAAAVSATRTAIVAPTIEVLRRAITPAPEPATAITLTLLYENTQAVAGLAYGWGFSCLIQGLEQTILFDTGADGAALMNNFAALDLDPQMVDVVVLSHIHADHTDGLAAFLAANAQVSVYVPDSFPSAFCDGVRATGAELIKVSDPVTLCPGAHSTGEIAGSTKEQGLVIEISEGLVFITGCAHPGISRMARRATELIERDLLLVLGGFHLGQVGASLVDHHIAELQELGARYVAPCHCTGAAAQERFHQAFGERYITVGTGTHITLADLVRGEP